MCSFSQNSIKGKNFRITTVKNLTNLRLIFVAFEGKRFIKFYLGAQSTLILILAVVFVAEHSKLFLKCIFYLAELYLCVRTGD